jgi:nucleoside-diphosphate kinase
MSERTLILIKPDGVKRRLVGEIISRIERKGLAIRAMKMMTFTPDLADRHYVDHLKKRFYPDLKTFILSGPVVALAVEGPDAIALMRMLMGATRPTEAAPGTIRGDFAFSTTENLIHGSDSPEKAEYELGLFFSPKELDG